MVGIILQETSKAEILCSSIIIFFNPRNVATKSYRNKDGYFHLGVWKEIGDEVGVMET